MIKSVPFSVEGSLQAFNAQASHFDADDSDNFIIQKWRKRVRDHVGQFIKPSSAILELNAGTGLDAVYFSSKGHKVHATDGADGMIAEIRKKISQLSSNGQLTVEKISFDQLSNISGEFDYLFSNFGGLNCLPDLSTVGRSASTLLKPGGFLTWVIMPVFCPWELTWILKGKFRMAFRRFNRKGSVAHLDGFRFMTYYHSLSSIESAMGKDFKLMLVEGLGSLSPPPSATHFQKKFPLFTHRLMRFENKVSGRFPFNRWADHLVVTFKKLS